jgi:hypothetical protein
MEKDKVSDTQALLSPGITPNNYPSVSTLLSLSKVSFR